MLLSESRTARKDARMVSDRVVLAAGGEEFGIESACGRLHVQALQDLRYGGQGGSAF